MRALSELRERARGLLLRRREEREMDEELAFHIAMQTEKNLREGMSPGEAHRNALVAFGGVERYKEGVRDARGFGLFDDLSRDVRHTLRSLRRSPGFTLVALLTLALGIGANTAVFSVVNAVSLAPLPYPDAGQVTYVGWDFGGDRRIGAVTPLQFAYLREHARVFEGVATHKTFSADMSESADYDGVDGMRVSTDFFDVVGIHPSIGRAFTADENEPGGPRTAVLSYELWRNRFAADSTVVGRSLRLDGEPVTIVGVMPPGFHFVGAEAYGDLLVPLQLRVDPSEGGHNYNVIARLRDGVTPDQVDADLTGVLRSLRADHAERVRAGERGFYTVSYQDLFAGELQSTLWTLLGATLFVLIIACADVANLLLARATGRQREIATRVALGAGWGHVVRQLLVESLVLGVAAGAAGLLIGLWSLRVLLAAAPWSMPRAGSIGLDWRVLGFTVAISLVTTLLFGLVSAYAARRADLAGALREGGRAGESGGRRRARQLLIVAETAVSLVLLIGAGLLIASFGALSRVDPGFEPDRLVTVAFERTPEDYHDGSRIWRFEQQLLERVRALPGVSAAAGTTVLPLDGQQNLPMTVAGRPDATESAIQWRAISPDYFRTMRIPLVAGRELTGADAAGAPPVAIVTESTARHYWPGGNAIGQRIRMGVWEGKVRDEASAVPREIVGVVADTRDIALNRGAARTVFLPQAQTPDQWADLPSIVLRYDGAPSAIRDALARAVHEVDPGIAAPEIRPMHQLLSASVGPERFTALLMTVFAALALALTAVGIYGVVAYTVGQRRQEIGVRIALGADRRDVLGLVVRQGMLPVLLGLAIGLVAALALTSVLASMVYGVGVRDPFTFAGVAIVLAAVALLASYLPARRAASLPPATALRAE